MTKKTAETKTAETTEAVAATTRGRAVDPNSKASLASKIFADCYAMNPVPARKDIIDAAIKGAGLTKQGAATYLHNWRNKNGLVKHRGE